MLKSQASALLVDKGNHRHFMAKEIHEQPEVVGHTLAHYLDMAAGARGAAVRRCRSIRRRSRASRSPPAAPPIIAGLVARYWFERFAASAGRDRCRLGVPLSRCAARARRSDDLHFAIGRDRRYAGLAALRQGTGPERSSASSMCRPRPSRAKATSWCRRWPDPKSASPRPRPSPASWRCWPRWRIAAGRARGVLDAGDEKQARRAR